MLRVRQCPGPERPDLLAVGLQENALDERRVVDRRHAEGRKRLGVPLGARADRLLERLLAGLVLLGLRLSGGDRLLAGRRFRGFSLLGADIEQDGRGADGQRVDQRAGPIDLLDAGSLMQLPFEMGQADDMVGRDQTGTRARLRHHDYRVRAEGIREQRLVLKRVRIGVDQQVDARVRLQAQ